MKDEVIPQVASVKEAADPDVSFQEVVRDFYHLRSS